MNFDNPAALVIIGVIALISGVFVARHFFSEEARLERRRRRSNARVSTTVNRPMVKFSVRTRKGRRK